MVVDITEQRSEGQKRDKLSVARCACTLPTGVPNDGEGKRHLLCESQCTQIVVSDIGHMFKILFLLGDGAYHEVENRLE